VISEMNVVRRFLSAVKGGRLAEAAPRSRQISLYVSDVNNHDLSTVSSGPTMPSAATRADFAGLSNDTVCWINFPLASRR